MRALLFKNPGRHSGDLASRLLLLFMACLLLLVSMDAVAGIDQKFPEVKGYFPTATRFDDITGKPPAAAVYNGDKVIGYVFESVMVTGHRSMPLEQELFARAELDRLAAKLAASGTREAISGMAVGAWAACAARAVMGIDDG